MPRTLPLANQVWPSLRVLTRASFGSSPQTPQTSGSGSWKVWPVNNATGLKNGMFVLDWDRVCLPMVGRARFGFRFGKIDGKIISPSTASAAHAVAGLAWDSGSDSIVAPDLNGHEVRIQVNATAGWRTVWWGQVDCTQDVGWPGASVPSGDRIYNCVDALYRTNKWRLDRHGYAATGAVAGLMVGPVRGHPGYNTRKHHDSRLAGNRWSGGDQWIPEASASGASAGLAFYHTQPGSADAARWTDQQALEHALAAVRRPGEPLFQFNFLPTTANALLVSTSSWPVQDGDTVWDLLTRVLRRERGRGLAFLDWTEDSAEGPLSARITVMPQVYGSISYQDPTPGGTLVTISGASADANAVVDVDLINDHRNVTELFRLGDKDQFRLDGLESVGEQIQVVVTVSFADGATGSSPNIEGHSIRRGWTGTEQTTFRAKDAVQRQEERFRQVYNLFSLPVEWDFKAGGGNGGVLTRCDYRCAGGYSETNPEHQRIETGTIIAERLLGDAVGVEDTSLLETRILSDLPLYEAWNYVNVPARWDLTTEHGDQARRPILALVKVASNKYVKVEEVAPQMSMKVDGNAIWLYDSQGLGDGTRPFSDPSVGTLGALDTIGKYENLSFTIALELPHRVRFYSGLNPSDPNCRRRAQIFHPEHHLWLAHPGAIWDLNASSGTVSEGHAPRRAAAAGDDASPGLLRDDRRALAHVHFLTWAWYGTDRRTAAWGLRACGFLDSFTAYLGVGVPTDGSGASAYSYPTIGQTVHEMQANGETVTIDTPITRISYDNQTGVTTWETDWSSLDLQR